MEWIWKKHTHKWLYHEYKKYIINKFNLVWFNKNRFKDNYESTQFIWFNLSQSKFQTNLNMFISHRSLYVLSFYLKESLVYDVLSYAVIPARIFIKPLMFLLYLLSTPTWVSKCGEIFSFYWMYEIFMLR